MTKVAFWMPVYNEGPFLARTLDTVFAQTYREIHLLLSDNYSTDDSRSIIERYQAEHPNMTVWSPPAHCTALDHAFFMWSRIKSLDFDYFIHVGGHDWVAPNYVETLLAGHHAHPTAALVCGRGIALDKADRVLGEYAGKTPQLIGQFKAYNPFSIVTLTSSNVAIHGLMPAAIVRSVNFRYQCPALDVMFVAEVATHGDIIFAADAWFYQRISGTDAAGYLAKHMGLSENDRSAMERVMNLQFRYLSEVADLACATLPAEARPIYKSCLMGAYFLRWCYPDYARGQLPHVGPIVETFLSQVSDAGKTVETALDAYFASPKKSPEGSSALTP